MNNQFSISDIVGAAWEIVKKNIWPFLGAFLALVIVILIFMLPIYLIGFGLGYSGNNFDPDTIGAATGIFSLLFFLLYFLLIAASYYFGYGLTRMGLQAVDGIRPSASAFALDKKKLLHYFLGGLIFGIVVNIGFMCCIVPGIYLAIRLQFFMFYVLDQDYTAVDALLKSWDQTKGKEMDLFLFYLVLILIYFLGYLCCGIGILVAGPVCLVAMILAYRKISSEASENSNPNPTAINDSPKMTE